MYPAHSVCCAGHTPLLFHLLLLGKVFTEAGTEGLTLVLVIQDPPGDRQTMADLLL